MPVSFRTFWLPVSVIIYVCFAAARATEGPLPWVLLVLLPLSLAETWRRIDRATQAAREGQLPKALPLKAIFFGFCLWLAARSGPFGNPAFDAMANLGSAIASAFGLVALARVPKTFGLFSPRPVAMALDAAGFVSLLWTIALVLPSARALAPENVRLDPLAIDYATTTAAVGTLLVYLAASFRVRVLRRLELGVGERAQFAWVLSMSMLAVGLLGAVLDLAPPDRMLPLSAMGAAISVGWAATTPDPTRIARLLRSTLALLLPGAPLLFAAIALSRQLPQQSAVVLLIALPMAAGFGLLAQRLAKPLGPEQSRWLDAVEQASRGALEPEPEAAIRAAMLALTHTLPSATTRPELWRLDPPEAMSVDLAGYLHTTPALTPPRLLELAQGEPERTLRQEVLLAALVHKPEVRPVLAWFQAHSAMSATLIMDAEGPVGFLLLPHGNRVAPMTLEEARGLCRLAERISGLFAISGALARSRARELEQSRKLTEESRERRRLAGLLSQEHQRHSYAARALRTELLQTCYSAAAKQATGQLEALGKSHPHLLVITPKGVDAAKWLSVAHLNSPRKDGPYLIVDGASSVNQKLPLWSDDSNSPLQLADGGTLVVLNATRLPEPIQEKIADWLSLEAALPPSEVPRAGLYLAAPSDQDHLAPNAAFLGRFEARFRKTTITLPSLLDRPEDLHAMVVLHLARLGMTLTGTPLGIHDSALRWLLEHTWPANELELEAVLTCACASVNEPVITLAALEKLGPGQASDARLGLEAAQVASEGPNLARSSPARTGRRRFARTR